MNQITEIDAFFELFDEMDAIRNKEDQYNSLYEHECVQLQNQYSLDNELASLEFERIINALALSKNNQTKAAQLLDIGRTALIAKMKKYKIC